jgi:hypothetical protein
MRRRLKWHRGAFVLCMWLATGAIGRPVAANAQTTSSTPPSSGARATSPFMMEPSGAPGIPLGATEIATPGVSPIIPSPGTGIGNCAGSSAAPSSKAPFDGGGISGSAPLSCTDSSIPSSPLPSSSTAGRAGVPLGATEIGNAGISQVAPVAGPSTPANAVSITGFGHP